MGLYDDLATAHPKLRRGKVWCHECGREQSVDPAQCLRSGWPMCHGETMSIDSPAERKSLAAVEARS